MARYAFSASYGHEEEQVELRCAKCNRKRMDIFKLVGIQCRYGRVYLERHSCSFGCLHCPDYHVECTGNTAKRIVGRRIWSIQRK